MQVTGKGQQVELTTGKRNVRFKDGGVGHQ